jgi:PPK2 family polyphosphate:nucleotide phosphotransferase
MAKPKNFFKQFRVPHDRRIKLKDYDPAWSGDPSVEKAKRKETAKNWLDEGVAELAASQELLYAADTWAILLIFQAMDGAGKDSTIKHVMSGVNPQGCQVFSFKHPSAEELDHTFLWRSMKVLPERGRIGIFNRSYYEEVLIVKVHQHLLHAQRIPGVAADDVDNRFWKHRYSDINQFEQHLVRNGTLILKFFLHLSWDEQRQRFLDRLNDPAKHWKFSAADLNERQYWDQYMQAYEDMLNATSTEWAPWYIVPADHKWVSRTVVAGVVSQAIAELDLKYPEVSPEKLAEIDAAKRRLMDE